MRDINRIIIHYSYTPPSMDIGAEEIRKWHTDRGWSDIGYHFVIRRSGDVEKGRDILLAGAHTKSHNEDSIGIVLVGGKNQTKDENEINFTSAQWRALDRLIRDLKLEYETISDISGHRDNKATLCPGFNVKEWASTI